MNAQSKQKRKMPIAKIFALANDENRVYVQQKNCALEDEMNKKMGQRHIEKYPIGFGTMSRSIEMLNYHIATQFISSTTW